MTPYLLILDDTRSIADVQNLTPAPFQAGLPIVLCKDFKAAQRHMAHTGELCAHVCFDHYLYGSPNHLDLTGLDFAHWLCHYDECRREVLTPDFTFSVQSADPQGAAAIQETMADYQAEKRQRAATHV